MTKTILIWGFSIIAVLLAFSAIGTAVFECEGALGSGVQCTKGGAFAPVMESYSEMMEVGLIFFVFLGIPAGIVIGSVLLFKNSFRKRTSSETLVPGARTSNISWTRYLLLFPDIAIGLIFLANVLFD